MQTMDEHGTTATGTGDKKEAPTTSETTPEKPAYPCLIRQTPPIVLDKVCESMYYLWFEQKLAHDVVLIRIQRICRENWTNSNGRIHIDNGYIEQGRIVFRVNLAEADDGGEALQKAVEDIANVLCTTTDVQKRSNFMSDFKDPLHSNSPDNSSDSQR